MSALYDPFSGSGATPLATRPARSAKQTTPGRDRGQCRNEFLDCLDRWDQTCQPLDETEIRSALEGFSIDREVLGSCVRFGEQTYQRNLIHVSEYYEVLVLCWRSGQSSPIHDHAESICGVRVVEGIATETCFHVSERSRLIETSSERIEAGMVVVSRGGDIHQITNREPRGVDLISLHVYSPRLTSSRCFRIDGASLHPIRKPRFTAAKTLVVPFPASFTS